MISLAGPALMRDSASRLAISANNIANSNAPGLQAADPRDLGSGSFVPAAPQTAPYPDSTTDIGTEMVNMLEAQNAYSLGAKLLMVDADMQRETLNMIR